MTRITTYAAIITRCIILALGFILLPVIFIIYILSLLSETYLTSLFSFVTSTKNFLTRIEEQEKSNK